MSSMFPSTVYARLWPPIFIFLGIFLYAGETTWSNSTPDNPVFLHAGRMTMAIEKMDDESVSFSWRDEVTKRTLNRLDHPLWKVDLQRSGGEKISLDSRQFSPTIEMLGPDKVNVQWNLGKILQDLASKEGAVPEPNEISVACQMQAVSGNRIEMSIDIDNQTSNWSIQQVIFPMVALNPLGELSEDDVLVVPRVSGELIHDPLKKGISFSGLYPSGWSTMAFCAEWDPQGGLYFAVEDPLGSAKDLQVNRSDDQKTVDMQMAWPAPDARMVGNDFSLSGRGVLQLFDGDWFDAAQIYKKWVFGQSRWKVDSRRTDTPSWMKEIAVWVCTGGAPESVVEPTIRFAEFMGVPTAIHWYNWHQIPFDDNYPHYFPAKDQFAEGVKRLQEAGVRVMPYINGRLWDSDTEDFQTVALPASTKDASGQYYVEEYGSKQKLAPMCPTTRLWQEKVQDIVLRLLGPECNVDGVYIDQVAAASPRLCYDRSHQHPLNGGHWWTENGYWPMITELQQKMQEQSSEKMITTECNAEPYIHCFDGYLTWHFQYQNQIPLFASVYGGAIQMFGRSYSGNDQLAHRMKIGQSLVFGEQLGWLSPNILEHKETAEFMKKAAHMRHDLLPYLSWGEMARPPRVGVEIPQVTADWAWSGKNWPITDSAIQCGAWQSKDGSIAFLFANVTESPVRFTWDWTPELYGLDKDPVQIQQWKGEYKQEMAGTPVEVPIELPGLDIVAYLVKK